MLDCMQKILKSQATDIGDRMQLLVGDVLNKAIPSLCSEQGPFAMGFEPLSEHARLFYQAFRDPEQARRLLSSGIENQATNISRQIVSLLKKLKMIEVILTKQIDMADQQMCPLLSHRSSSWYENHAAMFDDIEFHFRVHANGGWVPRVRDDVLRSEASGGPGFS